MERQKNAASTNEKKSPTFSIPPWMGLVMMGIGLLLAVLVLWNIAAPLSELILGDDEDIPVPDGAILEKEWKEGRKTTQHEWLYKTKESGCNVASFYFQEGAVCAFSPNACSNDDMERTYDDITQIATCKKSEKGTVTGYSWDVYITSGYEGEYQTRFQIALYK